MSNSLKGPISVVAPPAWRVSHLELAVEIVRDVLETLGMKTLTIDLTAGGPVILVDVGDEEVIWTRFVRDVGFSDHRTMREHDDGVTYVHARSFHKGATIRAHWKLPPQ